MDKIEEEILYQCPHIIFLFLEMIIGLELYYYFYLLLERFFR